MQRVEKKEHQWAWFVGLWCAGLVVTALLSYGVRWVIFH